MRTWFPLLLLLAACPGTGNGGKDTQETAGPEIGKGGGDDSAALYHPAGYADSDQHGIAAKYQVEPCGSCHGAELTGGTSAVSCDSCHATGWRTDCTFCHGGTDNGTGAPPVDIDNLTTDLAFGAHTAHVEGTLHAAYDCTQCHVKPADVLSDGHFLIADGTPGVSEVNFLSGLSSAAAWDGAGGCTNLYCHGTGQGADGAQRDGESADCGSCHAVTASGWDGWNTMSGQHGLHLSRGLACSECHGATVAPDESFIDVALHVNGVADTSFVSGMVYDAGQCTGTCHSEGHSSRSW